MICEQCGGSGQVGPSFEDQFTCSGAGFDVKQVVSDLKWAMMFVREVRYTEQKENKDRILKYINQLPA